MVTLQYGSFTQGQDRSALWAGFRATPTPALIQHKHLCPSPPQQRPGR